MKVKGTGYTTAIGILAAAFFGFCIAANITHLGNHDKWTAACVFSGIFTLATFAIAQIKDTPDELDRRERKARQKYEKTIADIRRRRKALTPEEPAA